MRSLEINKTQIYYALYLGTQPIYDEDGNDTGEKRSIYGLPVNLRIRVSPNKGETQSETFGLDISYDSTMVTTASLPIDEFSILWLGKTPQLENSQYPLDSEGNQITGHTHTVVRVAKDINVTQYAIKRVSMNG